MEPAPECLATTNLSPYASRLIDNACICLDVATSTASVAASTTSEIDSTRIID